MANLRICLFGTLSLEHGEVANHATLSQQVQRLLAYLLLFRDRPHRREVIVGVFWGDTSEQKARSRLNTALWRLRRVLEPDGVEPGTYLMTAEVGAIGFNLASDHWLDVAAFEDQANQALSKPAQAMEADDVNALEQALNWYSGELLEGFYDDWILRDRQRMRQLYLNSLAHLMRCHGHRGAYDNALRYGQRILEQDPLREEIHREIMRLYLVSGQRARAVRQYEVCRHSLEQELGVPPMPETQALLGEARRTSNGTATVQGIAIAQPDNYQQALQALRQARQDFDEAQHRLQVAIQVVEQLAVGQYGRGLHVSRTHLRNR